MQTNSRQKLLEKIDQSRDKAVRFLRDMVVIPSVTGDEAEIQKFLSKYMTKIGLRGRYVGNRLGGAQEASRVSSRRQRI